MTNSKFYKKMLQSALAVILASGLVVPSIGKADEFDLYDANNVNQGDLLSIVLDDSKFTKMILELDNYRYELNGSTYLLTDIIGLLDQNPSLTLQTPALAQKVQEVGLQGQPIAATPVTPITPTTPVTPTLSTVSGSYKGGFMAYVDVAMNQFAALSSANIEKVYVDGRVIPNTQYNLVNGSVLRIIQVTKASKIQIKLVEQSNLIEVVF